MEWVGWHNARRLHESLDDVAPVEYEDADWDELVDIHRNGSTRRRGRGAR